jgi:hypothetical protein
VTSLSYQAPTLTVVGSVHQLTQVDKKYGPTDGNTFMGVAITNSSR